MTPSAELFKTGGSGVGEVDRSDEAEVFSPKVRGGTEVPMEIAVVGVGFASWSK